MRKLTQEEVIARFKAVHGDKYDYSITKYIDTRSRVSIICPIHGQFKQLVRRHFAGCGCPDCFNEHQRKRTNGLGINDIPYTKHATFYLIWRNMLRRCYVADDMTLPTYKGCSVCQEWHILSNFKMWFDENYVEGYALDKDILVKGNKIYGPDTCCFVPQEINNLARGFLRQRDLPIGVSKRYGNRYCATLQWQGVRIHLGTFDTPEAAFLAYKKAKEQYVKELSEKYYKEGKITERVYNALLNYRVEITD